MSAVGDAVHVLPLLTALKRALARRARHVGAAARRGVARARAPGGGRDRRVRPLARLARLSRRAARARARAVRRRARAAGLLQGGHRHVVHARAGEARLRSRARARPQLALHHASHSAARGAARPGPVLRVPRGARHPARAESAWDLGPWPEERAWQREFLAKYDRPIAPIVVATSKPEKDWMPERWAEVCDALWSDFGLQPVLVGGRSPRELAAEAAILDAGARAGGVGARQRTAEARRHPRRRGARALAGHRAAAHDGRAEPAGDLADGLHEPEARRAVSAVPRSADRRVRRAGRGLSDLDGEPAGPHAAHHACATCSTASSGGERPTPSARRAGRRRSGPRARAAARTSRWSGSPITAK